MNVEPEKSAVIPAPATVSRDVMFPLPDPKNSPQPTARLDAKDMETLTRWSRRKVFNFFADHEDQCENVENDGRGRGTKKVLPLYVLPVKFQKLYMDRFPALVKKAQDLQDDLAWLADQAPAIVEKTAMRKKLLDDWQAAKAKISPKKMTTARVKFAAAHGVSSRTLHRMEKDFEKGGLRALAPDYGLKSGYEKLDGRVVDDVVKWYLDPAFPGRKKAHAFSYHRWRCEVYEVEEASEATIYRLLNRPEIRLRKRLNEIGDEQQWMDEVGPYTSRTRAYSHPGHAYVSDHKQLDNPVITADGKRIVFPYMTAWVDAYSTRVLSYRLVETPNSDSIKLTLLDAVADFGKSEIVHMDNGKDYRCKMLSMLFALLSLRVVHARVRNAKSKIIERVFRLFSERFAASLPGWRGYGTETRSAECDRIIKVTEKAIEDGKPLGWRHGTACTWDEYEEALKRFRHWYDCENPTESEAIEGMTPEQAWDRHEKKPTQLRRDDLAYLLLKRKDGVKVHHCRVILLYREYENVEILGVRHGLKVNLRYDPADLSRVFIYDPDTDVRLGIAELVIPVPIYQKAPTEVGAKKLARAKKTLRKRILGVGQAEEDVRDATLSEMLGVPPSPDDAPTTAGRDNPVPITEIIPGVSRQASELKTAMNDQTRPARRSLYSIPPVPPAPKGLPDISYSQLYPED
jgi:transposase InsO family protein